MTDVTDQVRDFTVAIRESLMEYYKGSCGTRFHSLYSHDLRFNDVPLGIQGRRAYQYERREHQLRAPLKLFLRSSPLMKVSKNPDEAVMYMQVFSRSPQLTDVHRQLKQFFEQYLSGVTLKENTKLYQSHHVPNGDEGIGPTPRTLELEPSEDDVLATVWNTAGDRTFPRVVEWEVPDYVTDREPQVQLRSVTMDDIRRMNTRGL